MLPEEITRFVGKTGETVMYEVERGAIRKYADAIDDPNPLYWDDEHARNSRYGSVIAPPGFFGWPTKWTRPGPTIVYLSSLSEELAHLLRSNGFPRGMGGGINFEFFLPVRAGDVLAATPKCKSIVERQGKDGGKFVVWDVETTYVNQNGDVVATSTTNGMSLS